MGLHKEELKFKDIGTKNKVKIFPNQDRVKCKDHDDSACLVKCRLLLSPFMELSPPFCRYQIPLFRGKEKHNITFFQSLP